MNTLKAIELADVIRKYVSAKIEYELNRRDDSDEYITSSDAVDKAYFELQEYLETI